MFEPNPNAFETLESLLALIADPKAAAARLAEHKATLAELNEARAALASEREAIAAEKVRIESAAKAAREKIADEWREIHSARADLERRLADVVERESALGVYDMPREIMVSEAATVTRDNPYWLSRPDQTRRALAERAERVGPAPLKPHAPENVAVDEDGNTFGATSLTRSREAAEEARSADFRGHRSRSKVEG